MSLKFGSQTGNVFTIFPHKTDSNHFTAEENFCRRQTPPVSRISVPKVCNYIEV
jgi:hypothetical protein